MAVLPIAVRWAVRPFAVQEVPRPFAVRMEVQPLVDPMAGRPTAPPTPITAVAHIITVVRPSSHPVLAQVWRPVSRLAP
jgi:hypothetical protein